MTTKTATANNCINKLAVGCCLLNHCNCYDDKDHNDMEVFDNSLSGILARDIFSKSNSQEEDRERHYRLGQEPRIRTPEV